MADDRVWTVADQKELDRAVARLQATMRSLVPRSQPLPRCHRHPTRWCPGECQYILPHEACLHDKPTVPPEGRGRSAKADVGMWYRLRDLPRRT